MTPLPSAERDLPSGQAARMRADLLTRIRAPRRTRLRIAVAAAATVLLLAGVLAVRAGGDDQVLAMTPAEMNPHQRSAAQQCLKWNRDTVFPAPGLDLVGSGDVVLSARQGHRSAVMFLNDAGYLACDVDDRPWREPSGTMSTERWSHRDWVPGPVQILSLSSTDPDGGEVNMLGRVSARVARLTLEHGTGRTTDARLDGGVFGLLSRSGRVDEDAELVAYDRAGSEIYRRVLFTPPAPACWTGPDGTVYYGEAGPVCGQAESWSR